ncbi:MAG: HypC/HybG/HupF family hydrogenase formation chaperone [Gemmatimonadaceae bacterium]
MSDAAVDRVPGCSVCGDEAFPARVLEVRSGPRSARVMSLATRTAAACTSPDTELEAALDLVDGIAVGDVVLVHQGFVIGRVDAS